MSPKSLLRHKDAISTRRPRRGQFQTVIDDADSTIDKKKVERIVLCSGKVYYDLFDKQRNEQIKIPS